MGGRVSKNFHYIWFVGCCFSKAYDGRKRDCGFRDWKRENVGISTSSDPASA